MAATDRFPIPPTGSPIPRGWFARLVAFINSLVLHGDGRFTLVNRSAAGTTVTLTPSLINRLNQSAPAPSSGGGGETQDISASVDGGTASITLSGSTSAVNLVGTGDVTISGNTETGAIEIGCTGGGGGGGGNPSFGFPDYAHPLVLRGYMQMNYPYIFDQPVWIIGEVFAEADANKQLRGDLNITGVANVFHAEGDFDSNACLDRVGSPVSLPIPAFTSFELQTATQAPDISLLAIYPCIGISPLADYTVTRSTGTTNGTLFYGLSQQGDNTVSVDSSLDGTPLDFEGASVL